MLNQNKKTYKKLDKINFIFFSNSENSSGVANKMKSFSKSFEKKNFKAESHVLNSRDGLLKSLKILIRLSFKIDGICFIRYNNSLNIFFFISILILFFRRKKIILDVPTPIINNLKELKISKTSFFKKLIIIFNTLILGPLPFLFSNLVLQYADENWYFNFLNRNNLLIGNGIDSEKYSNYFPKNHEQGQIKKFVIVANLAPWHGIDKIIIALSKVNYRFVLNIIGDGVEFINLIKIAEELKMKSKIKFHGSLPLNKYVPILYESDLGIGSMSWDLVGVKKSSTLKLREYACCGIPVLYSGFDIDFENTDFNYKISNSQGSIDRFFKKFNTLKIKNQKKEIFKFARTKLDMDVKVETIFKSL